MLLPVDSMKLLLEPLELMELLELAERKGARLLKKIRGEKRLRLCRILQPVPRGRALRLRLRLRLAAPLREAAACAIDPSFTLLLTTVGGALAMMEQVMKEQLLKVMLDLRPSCCCEVLRSFWLASSCRALRTLRGLRAAQRALRGTMRALRAALRALPGLRLTCLVGLLGLPNGLGEGIMMDIEALMLPHPAPTYRVDPLELLAELMELVETLERAERKGLLPLRLGGASCGGAQRRRLARPPGSCPRLSVLGAARRLPPAMACGEKLGSD